MDDTGFLCAMASFCAIAMSRSCSGHCCSRWWMYLHRSSHLARVYLVSVAHADPMHGLTIGHISTNSREA